MRTVAAAVHGSLRHGDVGGRYDADSLLVVAADADAASALALALFVTTLGMLRQRALRKRIARQSLRIAESEAILAEAQSIAHLGNWHYNLHTHKTEPCRCRRMHPPARRTRTRATSW